MIVGEDELARQAIEVKEMATHTSHQIAWSDLEDFLNVRRKK